MEMETDAIKFVILAIIKARVAETAATSIRSNTIPSISVFSVPRWQGYYQAES